MKVTDNFTLLITNTDAFNRKSSDDEEIGNQLKEKYQIQMTYYRNTLETILKRPVRVTYIFQIWYIRNR